MDQLLPQKTLDVSRGLTYTYYTSPAKPSHETLLLIHGFPDSPDEFADVVRDYLLPNGYGVIAIDCLGYGGTSKPGDEKAYSFQLMAQDIKEILDKEGVDKVVSTGHDWVRFLFFCTESLPRPLRIWLPSCITLRLPLPTYAHRYKTGQSRGPALLQFPPRSGLWLGSSQRGI